MSFYQLNVDKALEVVAVLLRQEHDRRMNFMRLLKLIYLADRKSLETAGQSITSDRVVAMERGLLPGGIYDLIKGTHIDAPRWAKFFEREHFDLHLISDPGNRHLSRFDIDTLMSIYNLNRDLDEWDLVLATHQLPEFRKNDPGESSKEVPIEDILEAVGRSSDADAIIKDAKDAAAIDRFFGAQQGR